MNNESPQHSTPPASPVDPAILRVLRSLDPVARGTECPYFVVGATARDLILVNLHSLRPGRATRDIDFGIADIGTWQSPSGTSIRKNRRFGMRWKGQTWLEAVREKLHSPVPR